MSLKGYEWLKDNKVIMYFTFKYLELTLLEDVSKKDLEEFKKNLVFFHAKTFLNKKWYL